MSAVNETRPDARLIPLASEIDAPRSVTVWPPPGFVIR
jgi:hypothetical protein